MCENQNHLKLVLHIGYGITFINIKIACISIVDKSNIGHSLILCANSEREMRNPERTESREIPECFERSGEIAVYNL